MSNSRSLNNPIRQMLLQLITLGNDIGNPNFRSKLNDFVVSLLDQMGVDYEEIPYLDYEVRKINEDYYVVEANNFVTALWFSGILPNDCQYAEDHNEINFEGYKYSFNNETKKLIWKPINK